MIYIISNKTKYVNCLLILFMLQASCNESGLSNNSVATTNKQDVHIVSYFKLDSLELAFNNFTYSMTDTSIYYSVLSKNHDSLLVYKINELKNTLVVKYKLNKNANCLYYFSIFMRQNNLSIIEFQNNCEGIPTFTVSNLISRENYFEKQWINASFFPAVDFNFEEEDTFAFYSFKNSYIMQIRDSVTQEKACNFVLGEENAYVDLDSSVIKAASQTFFQRDIVFYKHSDSMDIQQIIVMPENRYSEGKVEVYAFKDNIAVLIYAFDIPPYVSYKLVKNQFIVSCKEGFYLLDLFKIRQ